MTDFNQVSIINLDRANEWHSNGIHDWSVNDWAVAMAGEAGEICNAAKKLKRYMDGLQQNASDKPVEELISDIATEIGDTYLYLDLLAQRLGLRIYDDCIVPTFNRVSDREGFSQKLE